jgi:hypothetical protein
VGHGKQEVALVACCDGLYVPAEQLVNMEMPLPGPQ